MMRRFFAHDEGRHGSEQYPIPRSSPMKWRLLASAFSLLLFTLVPRDAEAICCVAGPFCFPSRNCNTCEQYLDAGCGCWRSRCLYLEADGGCGCAYDPETNECTHEVGNCYYRASYCDGSVCNQLAPPSLTIFQQPPGAVCTAWPWEPPQRRSRPIRLARRLAKTGTLLSGT